MFVHHVFFWRKEALSSEDILRFEQGLRSLLTIKNIKFGDVGKPAMSNRAVIDSSYSYSLLLAFESEADHDEYQVDPTHKNFVESCSPFWSKVLIYDSDSI